MPTGNYIFNPQNPQALQESDLDDFVFTLLNDICEVSSNLNLKDKSIIQYYLKQNVTELTGDKNVLISFDLARDDTRNNNMRRQLRDNGGNLKAVYNIGLIAKYDGYTQTEVKKMFEEIVDGITDNWNGKLIAPATIEGQGKPTNYEVTLNNGKKLNSPLTLNEADNYFDVAVDQPENPNYIAVSQKIALVINRS